MKKFFKRILGITKLEQELRRSKDTINSLSKNEDFVLQELNKLKEFINVGVEVNLHSPNENWAVVCIQGKPDYIKFISLESREIRDLQRFLRNFDKRNVTLDAPRLVDKRRLLKL